MKVTHAAVLASVLLGGWLRLSSLAFEYHHPDEIIATAVAERMLSQGSVDTNWRLAELPSYFKYDQYNFSGYYVVCAATLGLARTIVAGCDALLVVRSLSALLGTLGVLAVFLVARRAFDERAGAFATLAYAVNPQLYQDAIYGRPEAMSTLLPLLLLGAAFGTSRPRARAALLGLLCGFACAIKVSFLSLWPFAFIPFAVETEPLDGSLGFRESVRAFVSATIARASAIWPYVIGGAALGFAIGAPGAVRHPDLYVFGVRALATQYTGGHWPHGVPDAGTGGRLAHAFTYFACTTGALTLVLATIGAIATARARRIDLLCAFALGSAPLLYFGGLPVFFERNVSHVLPLLLIFAGYGASRLVAARAWRPPVTYALTGALVVALVLPAAYVSATIRVGVLPGEHARSVERVEQELDRRYGAGRDRALPRSGVPFDPGSPGSWSYGEPACRDRIVVLLHYGDRDSERLRRSMLRDERFEEVARVPSDFEWIPTSTLHTYLSTRHIFLHRAAHLDPACRGRAPEFLSAGARRVRAPRVVARASGDFRPGAAFPSDASARLSDDAYLASWSGSDAHVGSVVFSVPDGCVEVDLPYLTGPSVDGLSIRVIETGGGVREIPVLLDAARWRLVRVAPPPSCAAYSIEVVDAGTGWGAWIAAGYPLAPSP